MTIVARIILILLLSTVAGTGELPRWGVNGHPINNGHPMEQTVYTDVPIATQLDLVAELGAGWYRVGLSAADLRARGERFEELLREAERHGIRLLPVLFPAAGFWEGSATVEEIRKEASTFAREIVGRYHGRITHWELANEMENYALTRKGETNRAGKLWSWNEAPEGSSTDDYDTSRYERVKAELVGLYEGVKAADPAAQAVVDTAGWLHFGFIERLVHEDRLTPFDILSWHWYSHMGEITNVQGKKDMLAFLARYQKPLWITEINRHPDAAGTDPDMADYFRTELARLGARPDIGALFVYELLDQPYHHGVEGRFGLVETKRNSSGKWEIDRKKEAFAALKKVIRTPR